MPSSHLFLIGYRGCGKSTVGALLARRLGRPFLDTDAWIETHAGRKIAEIFAQDGEEAFRDLETQAIEQIPDSPPLVVSLGGGAVLREGNRELLRRRGQCVWLNAQPADLAIRIRGDAARGAHRPSLTGRDPAEEIEQVLAQREPMYREASDLRVETGGRTPDELAQAIADWYASRHAG